MKIEEQDFTINDYLQVIVDELNTKFEKEYVIKCFKYLVKYESYGTRHDFPLDEKEQLEGVISITTKDFDVQNMFQGYLCYPDEYSEFYDNGDFILCFGPSKELLDFNSVLRKNVEDFDLYNNFYGLNNIDNFDLQSLVLSKK